jgi:hypothetical protein
MGVELVLNAYFTLSVLAVFFWGLLQKGAIRPTGFYDRHRARWEQVTDAVVFYNFAAAVVLGTSLVIWVGIRHELGGTK